MSSIFYLTLTFCCWTIISQGVESQELKCKLNEFRCEDGSACLLSEKLCNGVKDCNGGEDETGSDQWNCGNLYLGTSSDCGSPLQFFKCRFGGCVPRIQVCDGVMGCWGGSDEASDLCENGLKRPYLNNRPQDGGGATASRIRPSKPAQQNIASKPSIRPVMSAPRPAISAPRPAISAPRPKPQRPTNTNNNNFVPSGSTQRPMPLRPAPSRVGPSRGQPGEIGLCKEDIQEEGVDINCAYRGKPTTCMNAQNGTIATYSCKGHFHHVLTSTTRRMCKNNVWTKRKQNWQCILECGVGGNEYASFITGGEESKIGKWPWTVGLYQRSNSGTGPFEQFCGGTLISTRAVLTAAHCVTLRGSTTKRKPEEILLYFGKFYRNVDNNDEFVQMRRVERIHVHDYYESVRFGSDIAILWLDKRVDITNRVLPVCLPMKNNLEAGDSGILVGWGRYVDGYPNALQEANIPIVSTRVCSQSHPSLEALIKSESFCAGHRNGTSACDGDSGNGLVFDERKKWEVHGIVSAGVSKRSGGCDPRFYTVFTRVIHFRDWIDKILDEFETK